MQTSLKGLFMPATNIPEQRKYKRIELPKTLVLHPGNACVLVNISRGGLLFKSLSLAAWPEKWLLDTITIKSEFDIESVESERKKKLSNSELEFSSIKKSLLSSEKTYKSPSPLL